MGRNRQLLRQLRRGDPAAVPTSGSGLPEQWTTDESGNGQIAPAEADDSYNLAVIGTSDSNAVLAVFSSSAPDTAEDSPVFQVKDDGRVLVRATGGTALEVKMGSGAAMATFSDNASPDWQGVQFRPGPGAVPLAVHGAFNQSEALFLVDKDLEPYFRIDADGSVHIKTGTSIIADL